MFSALSRIVADRYRLEGLLGEGGMGAVYRAVDARLERTVAVKLVKDVAQSDPTERAAFVARSLREARAAAALHHPNVVTVFDYGEEEGTPYLVLEYLKGSPLRHHLGRTDLAMSTRVSWLHDIALALAAAHDCGLVHRDVKPDNIFVCDDGVIKVLDFGIAKRTRAEEERHLTAPGGLVGTPAYMSPEQLRNEDLDGRSDQFSWGVLAYEVLTGDLPWAATTDLVPLVLSVINDEPLPPRTRAPNVPEAVEAIVVRALCKTRDQRYPSMHHLVEALAAVLRSMARERESLGQARTEVLSIPPNVASAATPESGQPRRRIIDPPYPQTTSPAALEAYREAMGHFRDGNWLAASKSLARAVELDPNFATALMRLAHAGCVDAGRAPDEHRAIYRRALDRRRDMSSRDRALLSALEPLLLWVPSDVREHRRRLLSCARSFPGDADILCLSAFVIGLQGGDLQVARDLGHAALDIDPEYTDAMQLLGCIHANLDDSERALQMFGRALAIAPNAADVYWDRAMLYAGQGDARNAEADAKSSVGLDPTPIGYDLLASSALALGKPLRAVHQILKKKWAVVDPRQVDVVRAFDEAQLAILEGDLDRAARTAMEAQAGAVDDASIALQGRHALLRIECALEMGDLASAGAMSMEYLERHEGWARSPNFHHDATPVALAAAERAGLLSSQAANEQRDAWMEEKSAYASTGVVWGVAYAPASALASAMASARAREAAGLEYMLHRKSLERAHIGRVLLALGRPAEAVPHLRVASRACLATMNAFAHVRASLDLGEAHEQTGDHPNAIVAYRAVVERWGEKASHARSTVRAKERLAALAVE